MIRICGESLICVLVYGKGKTAQKCSLAVLRCFLGNSETGLLLFTMGTGILSQGYAHSSEYEMNMTIYFRNGDV